MFRMLFLCLISLFVSANEPKTGEFLGAKIVEKHPDWFKQSFLDINEDITESAESNKHIILYVGQNGCPYCAKLIEDNFHNPTLVQSLRQHFDVVAINMWGDREITALDGNTYTEKEFAAKMAVQFTPTLLFFDMKGNVVLRLNGYQNSEKMMQALEYVKDKHYQTQSFAAFKTTNAVGKITRLSYAEQPPYILTRNNQHPAQRYLAVLFDAPHCQECEEFKGDLLERKNIKKLLTQMEVVQLDTTKDNLITPDGNHISAKNWYQDLDLTYFPALVIFDKSGKEIIRKDAFFKEFHFESILDYALTGAYLTQPNFQRYIEHKADVIRKNGKDVDIWR